MNYDRYVKYVLLPSTLVSLTYILLLFIVLKSLARIFGLYSFLLFIIPIFIIIIALLYPRILKSRKKKEIEDNIHFYITHLGALATSEVDRKEMMKILSEKREYKALAEETRKIYLLVDKWNKSLAQACRFVAKRTPSKIFADFLDRMAHELDSGVDFREFIMREQEVVMNSFVNLYQGKLYSIDIFKEIYVSITLSLSFFSAFAIIAPFLTGIDVTVILSIIVIFFIIVEIGVLIYLKAVAPSDPVWQTSGELTKIDLKIYKAFYICCILCLIVFTILLSLSFVYRIITIPPSFIISLTITPLIVPGIISRKAESLIKDKDRNAPSFLMSLGTSASARGGNILETLKFLTAHDFGSLTSDIKALYKRLCTRLNKKRAWEKFSIDTGSNLIYRFTSMFVEAINLGSDPKDVAKIVAKNFIIINNLRERRDRCASSFIGICYGIIIGIAFSMYVSVGVVEAMNKIYSTLQLPSGFLGRLLHTVPQIDIAYLHIAVLFILFFHAAMASIAIKIIDGGRWMSGFIHFVGMTWFATIVGYVSQVVIMYLLGI